MRFRTGPATNWEGRRWVLAPSLVALATEIDSAYPRPHPTDGTVASRPHDQASPSSDHRPRPTRGAGVVRAIDFGETTEDDAFKILETIRKRRDPRVKYAIHEGRIFSSYDHSDGPAYTWRPYRGPSPHVSHGHVSSLEKHDNDTGPWGIAAPRPPDPPGSTPPPATGGSYTVNVSRRTVKKGSRDKADIAIAQSLLAQKGFPPANSFDRHHQPDGIAGPGFDRAVRQFQAKRRLTVDGIVGPKTWAAVETS